MNFDTLYALDKKGKLRVFYVVLTSWEDEAENAAFGFITTTGLIDGKKTDKATTCSPKNVDRSNETSPAEQAELEAKSKWNEKLDEGYKSFDMLKTKIETSLGGGTVDKEEDTSIPEIFRALNITYNTNRDWHELPMLATKEKDVRDPTYPMWAQPKYNGVRSLTKLGYLNLNAWTNIIQCSRGGGYYDVVHIKQALQEIFRAYPDIVLDGELYEHGVPLQTISGTARKVHKDMHFDDTWLKYYIYDMVDPIVTQTSRFATLDLLRDRFGNSLGNSIIFSERIKVNNRAEAKKAHDKYVSEGYEGAVLRDMNGMYEIGFRSNNLIKVKEFIDEEFTIIGIKAKGWAIGDSFVWLLLNNTNSLTFFARPTGTRAMKEYWFKHHTDFIGKLATVRFQERTEDDLPHQGHVRSEKSKELVVENIV